MYKLYFEYFPYLIILLIAVKKVFDVSNINLHTGKYLKVSKISK